MRPQLVRRLESKSETKTNKRNKTDEVNLSALNDLDHIHRESVICPRICTTRALVVGVAPIFSETPRNSPVIFEQKPGAQEVHARRGRKACWLYDLMPWQKGLINPKLYTKYASERRRRNCGPAENCFCKNKCAVLPIEKQAKQNPWLTE